MRNKLLKSGAKGELQKKQLDTMATNFLKNGKNKQSKKDKRQQFKRSEINKRKKILKRFNEQLALSDDMFK